MSRIFKPLGTIILAIVLWAVSLPLAAETGPDPLRVELEALEPDELSPREALEILYRLKQVASE